MIRAQIIPNNNLNPKSKFPTINSTPINPKAKPASTENTNCATAISCLFICFTEKKNIHIYTYIYIDRQIDRQI